MNTSKKKPQGLRGQPVMPAKQFRPTKPKKGAC